MAFTTTVGADAEPAVACEAADAAACDALDAADVAADEAEIELAAVDALAAAEAEVELADEPLDPAQRETANITRMINTTAATPKTITRGLIALLPAGDEYPLRLTERAGRPSEVRRLAEA